jgi:hypothetical protein
MSPDRKPYNVQNKIQKDGAGRKPEDVLEDSC